MTGEFVDLSARYPLWCVDPEYPCERCGRRPAEFSDAWGHMLLCEPCAEENGYDHLPEDAA